MGKDSKETWLTVDTRIAATLKGVKLDEREVRYLEWLSRMDTETVEVFAGLFEKIKKDAFKKAP